MSGEAVIGIDLGGTNCRGALVGADQVGEVRRMSTRIDEGCDAFLLRLIDFCRGFLAQAREQGVAVRAVGMGVPGVIAADGTVT
ncbi:MAG: ROK family protein, partial [Desulfuromonadales bacterium]|nr:ROK family protein [Desulfuromonadales bacterium]